jgi:hypothetical protein
MRNKFLIKYGLVSLFFYFFTIIPDGYAEVSMEDQVVTEPGGGLALHVWDRYVRRFRRDHNLSLSAGYQYVTWNVQRFGDFTDKSYNSDQASLILDYTFHILISGKTGYFLGSSAGYIYAKPDKLDNEFQPATSWLLPGVRAGLAYNYDPSGRLFAGFGAQLERFNGLRTHRLSGPWESAHLTGETYQLYAGIDLFFALDMAVHFTLVSNTTVFQKPADAGDFLVNARLSRRSQGAELGLMMHFL